MTAIGLKLVAGACVIGTTLASAGCGKQSTAGGPAQGTGSQLIADAKLPVTTEPGRTPVESVTWAVYREVTTVDPIITGDYPEQTAVSMMCEALLRQEPDGTLAPGLAESVTHRDPTARAIR